MRYVKVDVNGGIISSISYSSPPPAEFLTAQSLVEGEFDADSTYFSESFDVLQRPPHGISLASGVLKGVPSGVPVKIKGSAGLQFVADGTDITLNFDVSGVYEIEVENWPSKVFREVINVS